MTSSHYLLILAVLVRDCVLKISKGATRICSASIEGDKEEDSQDTCVGSLPGEEKEKLDEAQVVPASGRHSHLPVLRHIAAAALLRRFQPKVHDEPSYASIEEVAEDVEKVEVVEKIFGAAVEVEKVVEVAKKILTVVQENQVEKVVAAVEAAEDATQTVIVAESPAPQAAKKRTRSKSRRKSSSATPRATKSKPLERLSRLLGRTRLLPEMLRRPSSLKQAPKRRRLGSTTPRVKPLKRSRGPSRSLRRSWLL
jgi:hypothetical protein